MRLLRIYLREGCHLCEEMLGRLEQRLSDTDVRLEQVDVDRAAATMEAYGHRVPVLETPSGECLSEFVLDEVNLARFLQTD